MDFNIFIPTRRVSRSAVLGSSNMMAGYQQLSLFLWRQRWLMPQGI